MAPMRVILLSLALAAVAAPASAQLTQFELDNLRMQQQDIQRRAIEQQNQIMSLESRLRAEQAIADLQAQQRFAPRVAGAPYEAHAAPAAVSASAKYPSMPDAALADSNRRVQAAASNRR
jgi:hypothetical protein